MRDALRNILGRLYCAKVAQAARCADRKSMGYGDTDEAFEIPNVLAVLTSNQRDGPNPNSNRSS